MKSIEELGLKKRHFDPEFDKEEWFYKDKNGNLFPYWKEDIKKYVDPHKPATFLQLLQELDIPFIELQWKNILGKAYNSNNPTQQIQSVFARYLSLMKLKGYRGYSFNDTGFFVGRDIDPFEEYAKVEYEPITEIIVRRKAET